MRRLLIPQAAPEHHARESAAQRNDARRSTPPAPCRTTTWSRTHLFVLPVHPRRLDQLRLDLLDRVLPDQSRSTRPMRTDKGKMSVRALTGGGRRWCRPCWKPMLWITRERNVTDERMKGGGKRVTGHEVPGSGRVALPLTGDRQ
jgi:hypothetical protein